MLFFKEMALLNTAVFFNKLVFILGFLVLVSCSFDDNNSQNVFEIGPMNIFRENITVSGFSSGASMAIQTHLSHSSLFNGLAIFSQAFYHCGHHSLVEFGIRCSTTGLGIFPYRVSQSIKDAQRFEKSGLIDPLSNLARQRIFIWTGELDAYIPADMVQKNVDFYKGVGSDPNNIRFTLFSNASHLIPTEDFGVACNKDAGSTVYLGDCDYAGVYYALSYILRNNSLEKATPDRERLRTYNQSFFYPDGNIRDVAMGTIGFIYIPKRCESQKCYLHLNFHGCNEWPPHIAEKYILNSGFLPVAEANDIIMIFPLTTKVPQNMDGCWDFFSYTGSNFATKKGAQVKVIERILRKILEE